MTTKTTTTTAEMMNENNINNDNRNTTYDHIEDLKSYVSDMLSQMENDFHQSGNSLLDRMKHIGTQMDGLERNISDLMIDAGLDNKNKNNNDNADEVENEITITDNSNDIDLLSPLSSPMEQQQLREERHQRLLRVPPPTKVLNYGSNLFDHNNTLNTSSSSPRRTNLNGDDDVFGIAGGSGGPSGTTPRNNTNPLLANMNNNTSVL